MSQPVKLSDDIVGSARTTQSGKAKLQKHLANRAYPHYEADPEQEGVEVSGYIPRDVKTGDFCRMDPTAGRWHTAFRGETAKQRLP